jgi:FkbM family methyltransferase
MIIYIDLGCGDGQSVARALAGGSPLFDIAHEAEVVYAFDPIRRSAWSAFKTESYNSHPAFHFFECAVGVAQGLIQVCMTENPEARTSVVHNDNYNRGEKKWVKQIDFSEWLKESVRFEDTVIVKMDIEGSEYDLLEKLIRDRTIHYVNYLFVEFHASCMGEEKKAEYEYREAQIRATCPIEIGVYGGV